MSKLSNLEMFMKECASLDFEKDASLSCHSTFKVGGIADYIAYPKSESALCALVDYLNDENIKYIVIGNGSNLLFSDEGYRGVVVVTTQLKKIRKSRNTIYAECGVPLTSLALYAQKHGLSGLEFAYGIPGSVGGAVFMNAGAYDGEIKDVLQKSSYFDASLSKRCELYNAGHKFGYRSSIYESNDNVILSAVFELTPGDPDEIKHKMDGFMALRKEKQPLEYPSAGSTFKRCEGHYTSKMIDEAGLKGRAVGGAMVSEKHAGFVINKGNATSNDIKELISIIKAELKKKFDVDIQEEIKYID
ncbi:MAG: UDP-N-acetylmuramate dehydrogenase [Ruminococcaceae bacterium]|nr:UDP-N-acetylmuramate dehydrogenase [Oscillospiraceae bacterium]